MVTGEHPEKWIPSEQLRRAADLIDKARHARSEVEALAMLGSARDICERVAGELASVLDPHGPLVGGAIEQLARKLASEQARRE